ncbi:hypothetical protein Tco_0544907 [Tanacetum coccineum]
MNMVPACLEDIVSYLQPIAHKHTTVSIIGKLLFAATSYYVWSERNNRLFKKVKRTPDEIRDIIMVTVRTLGSMEVNLLDEEVSLAMDSLDSLVRGLGAVSKLCKSNLDVH